jgi:hypothetical protein
MKTESEIDKMISDVKDNLVDATGEGVLMLQGFVRALRWVKADEKDDGFREDKS